MSLTVEGWGTSCALDSSVNAARVFPMPSVRRYSRTSALASWRGEARDMQVFKESMTSIQNNWFPLPGSSLRLNASYVGRKASHDLCCWLCVPAVWAVGGVCICVVDL